MKLTDVADLPADEPLRIHVECQEYDKAKREDLVSLLEKALYAARHQVRRAANTASHADAEPGWCDTVLRLDIETARAVERALWAAQKAVRYDL